MCVRHRAPAVTLKSLDLIEALGAVKTNPVKYDAKMHGLQRAMTREALQVSLTVTCVHCQ